MANAFKVGDLVKLKNMLGPPRMLVKQVSADDQEVRCWWFSKNDELQDRLFNPGDLEHFAGTEEVLL